MLELLADGEWHRFGEILSKLGSLIRPDDAIRRYWLNLHNQQSNSTEPGKMKVPAPTQDQMIAKGRRRLIRETLASLRRVGKIESRGYRRDLHNCNLNDECRLVQPCAPVGDQLPVGKLTKLNGELLD